MNQFNTTKEELQRLGNEFKVQAIILIDELFNLAFWLFLTNRNAKKIVWTTYKKGIYNCDKIKADADWHTWLHRIFMKQLFDYYDENIEANDLNFELIDKWNANSNLISSIKENYFHQDSEKKIIKLLRKLPHNLSLPLVLKDSYDLTYRSIGEYLEVPDEVVAIRIYRARKLLFNLLAEEKSVAELTDLTEYNDEIFVPVKNLHKIALLPDYNPKEGKGNFLKDVLEKESNLRKEYEIQEFIKSGWNRIIHKKNAPLDLWKKIKKEAEKRFFIKI